MPRKAVLSGGKRDELIETALELFLENGYEKTSVRMILDHAGGEVGMFYHYFKSKDEIFNAAIETYLDRYVSKFAEISESFPSPLAAFHSYMELLKSTIEQYKDLRLGKFHWSMEVALHQRTVWRLVPFIEKSIDIARTQGIITNPLIDNNHDLAVFILFGVEGILHDGTLSEMKEEQLVEKKVLIKKLVSQVFGIPEH